MTRGYRKVLHLPDLGIAHLNLDGDAFEPVGVIAHSAGLRKPRFPENEQSKSACSSLVQLEHSSPARILE
jgi:hypothetical protein